jgi:hypothetical protein
VRTAAGRLCGTQSASISEVTLMPLDARKIARIVANRAILRQGRTTAVALVYRTAYGGQTAMTAQIILKAQGSSQPAMLDQAGMVVNEWLAEFDMSIDPSTIAYVALTGGATDDASLAAAVCVEVLSWRLSGLVPNRYQVSLRRFR